MKLGLSNTLLPTADPMRVLITGGGGAAAIAVIRSLAADNLELYVGDMDRHAAGLYLVPAERRLILPRGDDPDFSMHVMSECRRLAINVLVPTVDAELLPLAIVSEELRAAGTSTVLADEATLAVCLDKLALAEHCRTIVPVPRSEALDSTFDERDWEYPLIVKPRSGSGGRGVRLVWSPAELTSIERDGTLLVQAYLPGEEYSVDVFADQDAQVRAAVPRVRLKVDSGVAVTARTLRDPQLEQMARAVAHAIGLRFVANIQFKRDQRGMPRLLEVNPRFPGTMPLTVEAGVPMPRLALDAALGFDHWLDEYPFEEVAVVRHWQEVFLAPREFEAVSHRGPTGSAALVGVA